jgi:dolichol-phosphate mannosyltransferase
MNESDQGGTISDFGFRISDCKETEDRQSANRNPQSNPEPRTLVALATYNEIENLPGLLDEILRALPAADVLVVDDNSPDGTGHWCAARAQSEPRLHCLHRPSKQGLGSATLAAAQFAIDHGYDLFATLDADWSHDPKHLPELIRATGHVDVAIGSRYIQGGAIEGWPLHRRVLSRSVNRLSRTLLRLPVRDSSGAFRAYRVAKLKQIDLHAVKASGYAYLEEILWHLNRVDATFAEVPITFHQRRAGRSKINVKEAAAKVGVLIRLAFQF